MEEAGSLICSTYKVYLVPSGGLEVLLLLTFSIKSERIFKLMNVLSISYMTTPILESRQKTMMKSVVTMKKSI